MNEWDELRTAAFWDPNANSGEGAEFTHIISDRDLLLNYSGAGHEAMLNALIRIVVDLADLAPEEKKIKKTPERFETLKLIL